MLLIIFIVKQVIILLCFKNKIRNKLDLSEPRIFSLYKVKNTLLLSKAVLIHLRFKHLTSGKVVGFDSASCASKPLPAVRGCPE